MSLVSSMKKAKNARLASRFLQKIKIYTLIINNTESPIGRTERGMVKAAYNQ
jgi:hypothetical protein